MNKAVVLATILGFLCALLFLQNTKSPSIVEVTPTPTPTPMIGEFRAYFAIFTNNTFRLFTSSIYHNRNTAIYISKDQPNRLVISKSGQTWNDFFKSLPLTLSYDCLTTGTKQIFCSNKDQKLEFYLNNQKNDQALDMVISPGDRLLVTFGATANNLSEQKARLEAIQ